MPIFNLKDANGKIFKLEAPDQQSAIAAFKKFTTQQANNQPSIEGHVQQGMSGLNEGIAALPNMLMDGSNWIAEKTGLYDLLGDGTRPEPMSQKVNRSMQDIGFTKPPSQHASEQFVRRIGQEVGGSVIPGAGMIGAGAKVGGKALNTGGNALSRGLTDMSKSSFDDLGKFIGTETATSVGSGVGAATAQQVAPDSQLAEFVGQVLGGGSVVGAQTAITKKQATRQYRKDAPSTDDLKDMTSEAYNKIDDLDVVYNKQSTQRLADDMDAALQEELIDKDITPKATKVNEKIKDIGGSERKFMELENIRKLARRAVANSADGGEQHLGKVILEILDDFQATATAKDVSKGNAEVASSTINDARKLNTRYNKAKNYDRMMEKAENAKSGFDTGMDSQVRSMLNSDKRSRFNSPEETKQYKKILDGTVGQKILKNIGAFAPNAGVFRGIAHGAMFASNPVLGVPLALGTSGARAGASKLATNKVQLLGDMLRSGKPLPKSKFTNSQIAALIAHLTSNTAQPQNHERN
ncbi:MAG: hypothetical protein OCD03_13275 [Hyphomicrobiales bacterium]